MARLIDVRDQALPTQLSLRTGDVLVVSASGGFVSEGKPVVERLGPFIVGSLQPDGTILSPMGSPNTVLFWARQTGQATITVSLGDPFVNPQPTEVTVRVEG